MHTYILYIIRFQHGRLKGRRQVGPNVLNNNCKVINFQLITIMQESVKTT